MDHKYDQVPGNHERQRLEEDERRERNWKRWGCNSYAP